MKFGYDFKNAPLTVFGGLDTFKYNVGPGPSSPFAAFENTSGTVPGYGVKAGVEFRPTSNLSLSLGVGYVDQSAGRVDSDIRSPLLPGQHAACASAAAGNLPDCLRRPCLVRNCARERAPYAAALKRGTRVDTS